jgi:prolipoprotein diacylglyceryl transferase
MTALAAYLPSPDQGVWYLGPVPIRAYALCILLGIAAAIVIGERRWVARGGEPGAVADVAAWAVPFGIVGSRIYHLLTSPQAYFGDGGRPLDALKIWEGGLGIWGAIAGGAVGAYIGCRRRGWSFVRFADALAPGLAVGQAIGRFGNWFNQELFGRPTTVPWALEISPEHRPQGYEAFGTYHPTFLYESLWCLLVALAIVLLDRRYTLDRGRSFALYVAMYTLGRGFFEYLRIDPANEILGLRVNVWTSVVLGCLALLLFAIAQQRARRSASHHADDVPTIQDAQAPRNVG